MTKQTKKQVFSGIQPSGTLHIGNYLGAISQWVGMQDEHNCIFCVVDYHAITVKQDPAVLKQKIIEVAKLYLAAGIDPKKSVIFQQSAISAHTELAWILNTVARMSDLYKMTQFKDKTKADEIAYSEGKKFGLGAGLKIIKLLDKIYLEGLKARGSHAEQVGKLIYEGARNMDEVRGKINKAGVGLYDYPILMAADILLYNTDVVPVGEDQKQHVELTRDLAKRFNHQFGETFKSPEVKLLKTGARIMGLDDATKKMSKSAVSEHNYIGLTDEPAKAMKKIMRAETDSGKEIKHDPKNKPGISNLLVIYSLLSDKPMPELEKQYAGKGYGDFKKDLAEEVKKFLTKFQKKFNSISDNEVREVLDNGAEKIKPIAEETLKRVKQKLGIIG